MRALLSTVGSRGDVQPLLGMATELAPSGHEAHLCVPPDFRSWIEELGFSVTPVGLQMRRPTPAAAGTTAPTAGRSPIEDLVEGQFDALGRAAEGCDVIVAATALQIAARSVAEIEGIPYVLAAYCPEVFPSPHHAPPPLPPLPGAAARGADLGQPRAVGAQRDTVQRRVRSGAQRPTCRPGLGAGRGRTRSRVH